MTSDQFVDLLQDVGAGFAYGLLGIALLVLGYILVDLLTPGKLARQIWTERNRNAAIVLCASLVSVGAITTMAIWTSYGDLGLGLVSTACYGVLGLVLMGLAFALLDILTPGSLGKVLVDQTPHPAAWVTAAADVSVAAVVCGALS